MPPAKRDAPPSYAETRHRLGGRHQGPKPGNPNFKPPEEASESAAAPAKSKAKSSAKAKRTEV